MTGQGGPGQFGATPSPDRNNNRSSIHPLPAAHKPPLTKQQRVLRALLNGPASTFELERAPWFDHCAPSTISELRKAGLVIHTERIEVSGYAGQPARIARYTLDEASRSRAELLAFAGSAR